MQLLWREKKKQKVWLIKSLSLIVVSYVCKLFLTVIRNYDPNKIIKIKENTSHD